MATLANIAIDSEAWTVITDGFVDGEKYLIQNGTSSIVYLDERANAPKNSKDALSFAPGELLEITFSAATPIRARTVVGSGLIKRSSQ